MLARLRSGGHPDEVSFPTELIQRGQCKTYGFTLTKSEGVCMYIVLQLLNQSKNSGQTGHCLVLQMSPIFHGQVAERASFNHARIEKVLSEGIQL